MEWVVYNPNVPWYIRWFYLPFLFGNLSITRDSGQVIFTVTKKFYGQVAWKKFFIFSDTPENYKYYRKLLDIVLESNKYEKA